MIIKFTANHKIYIQNSTPRTRIEGRRRTWNDGRRKTLPPMKSLSTLASISCLMGGFVALFLPQAGAVDAEQPPAGVPGLAIAGETQHAGRTAAVGRLPDAGRATGLQPQKNRRTDAVHRRRDASPSDARRRPYPYALALCFFFIVFFLSFPYTTVLIDFVASLVIFCFVTGNRRIVEHDKKRTEWNVCFDAVFFLVELKFSWGASQLGNTVPRAPMHSSFIGQK